MEERQVIFRNSPFIILNGFVQPFIFILIILKSHIQDIYKLKNEAEGNLLIILSILAAVSILWAVFSFFRWKNTWIKVDNGEIFYQKKGLFFQENKKALLEDITNVKISANIFYRLFSVQKVTLDMNTVKTAKEDDFYIILSSHNAAKFREILAKKESEESETLEDSFRILAQERERKESLIGYRFSRKESIRHVLMSSFLPFSLYTFGFIASLIADFNLFAAVIIISGFIFTIIKTLDKFMNFSVTRDGNKISIERGLFTVSSYDVPLENIVSLQRNQCLPMMLTKRSYVNLTTIGLEDDSSELCVALKDDKLEEVVSNLLPEFKIYNHADSLPASCLCWFIIRNLMVMVPIGLLGKLAVASSWDRFLLPASILLALLFALYSWKQRGCTILDDGIIIRNGLVPEYEMISKDRIETVEINTNPVYNRLRLRNLTITKRSSNGLSVHSRLIFKQGQYENLTAFYADGADRDKNYRSFI